MIEHATFTYSPLGKALQKQTKTIQDQGKNQIKALKTLKPSEQLSINEVDKNEVDKMRLIKRCNQKER